MSIVNKMPMRTKSVNFITPVENDGTEIKTLVIDRKGFQSLSLTLSWATASGSPTTPVTAFSIWSNTASHVSSPTPILLATLETVLDIKTAAVKQYDIDLSNASRYIFVVYDATYSDGSSPKNVVSCVGSLGDANIQPAFGTTPYGR